MDLRHDRGFNESVLMVFAIILVVALADEAKNTEADIIAIGLQEIVDLSASNLVKTSQTTQRLWSDGLQKELAGRGQYVLVACEQLVGVCLFLYMRPRLAVHVRDLAIDTVKTGMGGQAGNKVRKKKKDD